MFGVARAQMPLLIGCGSAAGISAIFNSPIGGVFFTLEVILLDFSLRTITPVLLASVIANVTTKAILGWAHHEAFEAIFALPPAQLATEAEFGWHLMANFAVLGIICGMAGLGLTRMVHWSERWWERSRLPRVLRPAAGGALMGALGVLYVGVVGWWAVRAGRPAPFAEYPLPAFFSDGYGVIRQLVHEGAAPGLYREYAAGAVMALLGALCALKIVATGLTLGSGGSGGIIAPSLFVGAAAGGLLGMLFRLAGAEVQPHLFALVGMGAVLAAVVHAPLASILILLDLTHDTKIILPAMLASVVATGMARLLYRDSIYTSSLRARGVRVGTGADLTLLRRLTLEEVELEPAVTVGIAASFREVLDLAERTGAGHFVVVDEQGQYAGMVMAEDMKTALMQQGLVAVLGVADLVRPEVPVMAVADDLATVLDVFAASDVERLPVCVRRGAGKVIGVVGRGAVMRAYRRGLGE
jgi:CIC family chloride channel protein